MRSEGYYVNLFAQMQMLVSKWIRSKAGVIVNVCPIVGYDLNTNNAAYGISKVALVAFTKELSMELGLFGIRVNGVASGIVSTDMVSESGKENYNVLAQAFAMKRAEKSEEVAEVIYWLCSDDRLYVNGRIVYIDGGMI